MRLFVSYARIDKPFCIQFVDMLTAHEVWYDQRLYAGQHWWKEILRRLDWCQGFIYLLSPDSVASDYCRKELEIARKVGREIFPVLIDASTDLPPDLADLQYVDMTNGLNVDNVSLLLNSIVQSEREYQPMPRAKQIAAVTHETVKPPITQSANIIGKSARALEDGNYDQALVLLKQAKANDFQSRFIDIDVLIAEAERAIDTRTRRREAERDYFQIAELYRYNATRKVACDAFVAFQQEFPEYDPQGLAQKCRQTHRSQPMAQMAQAVTSRLTDSELLPMLQWCEIPGGIVRMEDIGSKGPEPTESVFQIDDFLMSKFPVTNAQFDMFLSDPNGYVDDRWWRYSHASFDWHLNHPAPLDSRFRGDDRPRENVNWYEAMAFCQWLTYLAAVPITLSTVAQWQRAAQGDDDRIFPWGNVYHDDACNTRESGLKMTTSVSRYQEGASPYDVFDMAGNVWEWCVDKTDPDADSADYKRAVIGGSYVSPCDRAQASFRYYLNPESRYSSIGFRLVAAIQTPNTNMGQSAYNRSNGTSDYG